uniref:Uncharacterized protein n=1 Tax=uncultured marine thaumarchaeote SAT1000_04_F07 TaxID=1456355 RepID=A0A075I683_9ARCH|nr:hypothetical protein [uncultured marine thaumarchaeote SAT1000_04_F07]
MTCDTVIVGSHVVLPTGIIDKNLVLDDGKIIGLTNEIPSSDKKLMRMDLLLFQVLLTHMYTMEFILP